MKRIIKINLLIYFIIFLCSCHSSISDNVKPTSDAILNEQYGRELYIKYQPEKYDKWQKLNKLLEKDYIPPKKLNVIDCRGFDPHSKELALRKVLNYHILDSIYSWSEYETERGRCILFKATAPSWFFLNQFEASILLSASLGYNFKKLDLEPPKILYKRTILNDMNEIACGLGTIIHKNNMTIHKNGCVEIIHYEYETKRPPEKRTPFHISN